MFYFMNIVRSFMNCAIYHELCDRMRFEVDCAKSQHRIISEGLNYGFMSWHSGCKKRLTRVLTKQNQCVWCNYSLLTGQKNNAKIYYALLEILELNNIYKLRITLSAHKIHNDTKGIPAIFSGESIYSYKSTGCII